MNEERPPPHPLDPCDPEECYKTMMAERTALITARRESEDNLIKTIVQVAAALIVLMAGFVSQAKVEITGWSLILFGITLVAMIAAIVAGLTEQYFSSKAYLEQQGLVEDFYQKKIWTFGDPPSNKWVRKAQVTAFSCFIAALVSAAIFALVKAGDVNVEVERTPTSIEAKGADNAATHANTNSATAPTSAAPSSPTRADRSGNRKGSSNEVGGAIDATTAPTEKELRPAPG